MEPLIFALDASRSFGEQVAACLGGGLARHEEREFEDGEHKVRPLLSVRGRDVFVVQSLHGDDTQTANDRLIRLLFFIGALRDAAAERVTALVPFLCYSRKDSKTKPRDPIATRYVAALFEAVGTDCIVTLDVHNVAAYQNAFRIGTELLEAKQLFVDHVAGWGTTRNITVISPDAGGTKRAEAFRQALAARLDRDIGSGFMEKYRSSGEVTGSALIGNVRDRAALIVDDMIASGTTLARAAQACRESGAAEVHALASHGAFTADAGAQLAAASLDTVAVTTSIQPLRLHAEALTAELTVIDCAPLFADAIRCLHEGGSLVDLLER